MGRILAIDYGLKRCGIAVTDPLQIIAYPMDTIDSNKLLKFIQEYCRYEEVERILLGHPKHRDGNDTYLVEFVEKFCKELKDKLPNIEIELVDEHKTSVQASQLILQSGISKKKRQDKLLIDRVSATLILQKYLGHL
ncbi:MAG: Holliday junction resolvase RuvX [Saprospiraceae bacterium]|nr:Holliday junction resolvase RuvX [Saprospiraceae bacterium]